MNILLVNPRPRYNPGYDSWSQVPPLSLMAIGSMIEGHDVEILDLKVERLGDEDLKAKLSGFDIVALSVPANAAPVSLEICRMAKEKGALTVVGGVHPTLVPDYVSNQEIDILVRGEGEFTFKEIIDGYSHAKLDLGKIKGISYRLDGKIVHNPERDMIADLDSLPAINRNLIEKFKYSYEMGSHKLETIETSRGCSFGCSFCSVNKMWNRTYREKNNERIIREMKSLDRDTEVLFIADNTFNMNMEKIDALCDMMIAEGLTKWLIVTQARMDKFIEHPKVVEKMCRVGFRASIIGIETLDDMNLSNMKKSLNMSQVMQGISLLQKNGCLVWGSLIVGHENDTKKDVLKTLDFSKKYLDTGTFCALTPFPGTDMYCQWLEEGLIDKDVDLTKMNMIDAFVGTKDLSSDELSKLIRWCYKNFYLSAGGMIIRSIRWALNPKLWWAWKFLLGSSKARKSTVNMIVRLIKEDW
jgi:radical SAM superfamily enzyme YgiQ (UPF0313 family)